MPRVVVVSPLPAVRAGLTALLGGADDVEVVGTAERVDRDDERQARADVLVVDPAAELQIGAGDDTGGPALLVLGPVSGDERLPALLGGRGWGYLARSVDGAALIEAVRAVAAGLVVVDPTVGSHLLARVSESVPLSEATEELTAREREVLQLVALGLPNKTIAGRLGISEHTVKFHVGAILGKLGAASRTEAVMVAARQGLLML